MMMMMMSGLWQDVQSVYSEPERPNQTGCERIAGINVGNKNQMEAIKQTSRSLSEEFVSTQTQTLKTFLVLHFKAKTIRLSSSQTKPPLLSETLDVCFI